MLPRFPLKLPKGPVGGLILDVVVEGAKKFLENFINSKSGKEISERDKLDVNNVVDVVEYNKLLNDFTKEVEDDILKLEEKIVVECTEYYEEFIVLIETAEKCKNINLRSKFIKRRMEKLKKEVSGNLVKNIHRQISLDNSELKEMLCLPKGRLKEGKIQKFKENLIKRVLNDFILELKEYIEDFGYDTLEELNAFILDMRKNEQALLEELSSLENAMNNDLEGMKNLREVAEVKLLLCDGALNLITE
jgi:hypothetical protein